MHLNPTQVQQQSTHAGHVIKLLPGSTKLSYVTRETWFHIDCQGLDDYMYNILNSSNLSWECINCGMPNFSTTFFNSTSIESTNSYSLLDSDIQSPTNIGHPIFSSSPINTQKSGQSVKSKFKQNRNHQKPIRVLNINFQ